ncbi:MAG: Phosphoribosylglycinamide formyltransferase [Candidatus Ordinivivax streblomastigis]|uniref:Phosphoribosylglycinamide formyltransferase n=1 Tax=Candidatus Ordinivivax streblomastigis TaxID=2540710 RepID=A0A5M8P2J3_9BACT|nr:MAG: Phosphoribosylglycinamide formyltransferase [Candidatus Ordinivivax streblomastigis]
MKNVKACKIALLASGSGSNAENIVRYFEHHPKVEFPLILANKTEAFIHERAKKLNIPSYTISKSGFENGEALQLLQQHSVDWIILAGFLVKIPNNLLQAFPNKIINIHPALLPKFGGKGMYGSHVHEAVVAHRETESGITIHYVNENYDEGLIIFQAKCPVLPADSPEDVAAKVHELEYRHFPEVIERVVCEALAR